MYKIFDRIREERARRGMTKTDFAELIGMTDTYDRHTVAKWEAGIGPIPTYDSLAYRLAKILGESTDRVYEMSHSLPEDIVVRMRNLKAEDFPGLRRYLDSVVPLSEPFIGFPRRTDHSYLTPEIADELNRERGYQP